ncbi:MAG TPA: hypothetical protein VJK48_02300 [Chlamydiales bacterium]|nr:hypothetical protein [Chlamydiales bacterium]
MKKHITQELPFRSKLEMLKDIATAIDSLHRGKRDSIDQALKSLKSRALFLDPVIQQDVLMFSEQIAFQYDYDNWHLITKEVQQAADQLIEDLGFHLG